MERKSKMKWLRRGLAITLFVLLAVFLAHDLTMHVLAWRFIQETAKDSPHLNVVPTPLPDNRNAPLSGMTISAYEYSLKVPWSDLDVQKKGKSVSWLRFKSGAAVTLSNPANETDFARTMRGNNEAEKRESERLFGARALSSSYDLMAAELSATPSQVKWWSTRATKARYLVLLSMKSMEIIDTQVIYWQGSSEMRGFQLGSPVQAPYRVELDLFDRNGRRYKILIASADRTHAVMTQAEVNSIVASLVPIPHS
ncbi:MAG: hypothetical protein P4L03_03300 [Terracidiphilus sp.]|nr:hypothetical protein [Terracidiphilus sp.]